MASRSRAVTASDASSTRLCSARSPARSRRPRSTCWPRTLSRRRRSCTTRMSPPAKKAIAAPTAVAGRAVGHESPRPPVPTHLDHRHHRGRSRPAPGARPCRSTSSAPSPCHAACPVAATSPSGSAARARATFAARGTSSHATTLFPRSPAHLPPPLRNACNRAGFDESLAICQLERYVGDLALAEGWVFARPGRSAASASRSSAAAPRASPPPTTCAGAATRHADESPPSSAA